MLEVKDLYKSYKKQGGSFFSQQKQEVLKGISFTVKKGECLGLIGESGSGKSTLSHLILGLEKPDRGEILMEGEPIKKWLKNHRGEMSVVFQDYTTSVNPRLTIENIIAEPLHALDRGKEAKAIIGELLKKVDLSDKLMGRYPHELSGGQLQRVCVARAISTRPRFIVLDEALSSLDVSIQAQILTLLKDLKQEMDMTYLFIAHDLQTLTNLCDKVLFLYKGNIVERVHSTKLFDAENEYAKRLLASVIVFGQ